MVGLCNIWSNLGRRLLGDTIKTDHYHVIFTCILAHVKPVSPVCATDVGPCTLI